MVMRLCGIGLVSSKKAESLRYFCVLNKCIDYHCCQLLQAVCCSDKLHCCPNGYKCDLSAGTCTNNIHSMSWNSVAVKDVDKSSSNKDCPGGKLYCPDVETCCQLQTGSYGCCPFSQVLDGIFCWTFILPVVTSIVCGTFNDNWNPNFDWTVSLTL